MKTLILHLSDIHFSKLRGTINAEPLVKACAKGTKPDNVILVFSGDFVDRPHRKNFEAFEFLFDNLKCRISEAFGLKSIDVVVTPGNHDIPLSGSDSISQTELVDNPASKRKNFERAVKSESDALAFCEKNGCSFIDGAIGEKNIEFQNVSIHFVMINSAPFSSVKYDDKEHHYLPDSCALIGRPSSTKKNIEILVSHHRPDWFDYDSSAKMVKFIEETATICLFGHEHDAKCYAQISDEDNVVISKGGRLRVINNTLTGSFSKLLIDDEKEEVTVEALTFNQTFGQFCSEPCHSYHLRLNDTKRLRDEFVNGVLNPQVVGKIHESDVFVMPLLRANGDQDDIGTLDSLVAFCLKEENCYLHGFHNCGKSSLLHRLFDAIRPKAWVVFLECGEYLTSNPEKAIKNAYEAQYYYSDFNYRDFYEAPREEKVIIVDAFEELRGEAAKDKYRDYFSKTFGSVVMAVSNSSYNAKVGLSVSCYEPDFSFEISGFSLKKRRELYAKIASMYGIIIDSDLDLISNCIEAALGLGSVIDISDPAFLVDIASCIIKDKYYLERDTRNDFSEAFQHSINAALTEVIKTAQLDDYYLLLSQLAADMAFVYKDRCFDAAQLQKAINERKERFAIKFEPFNEILENLLKSGLIASEKDKYRFERNSLNAFFAAKEVVRLYQKGDKSYLDIATEDITYGIYGDIVMFAAYQLQRVDVFFKMQDILEKGFKDIEEISYDKKNNEILRKNTRLIPETVEQAENRKQLYERLDKSERKAIAEAPKE